MRIDKLKASHETLEKLGRDLLINDYDIKTTLTSIIVILKELLESEIENEDLKDSMFR